MIKKQAIILLAAVAAAGSLQTATAMNYTATDLLLVFRETGFSDVEFDVGSVSNFLGLAAGTRVQVNYDTNLVLGNFNNTYDGVRFVLVAATSSSDNLLRYWATDANLATAPKFTTLSAFTTPRSKIESVGSQATSATVSNAAPYVVSPSSVTSYSYVVSGGAGGPGIVNFNGDVAFNVDNVAPTTLAFYEIRPSGANPKPSAPLIGAFTLDAGGKLFFTAGQLPTIAPSQVVQSVFSSDSSDLTFTTTNGVNYRLQYSTSVLGPWTTIAGPVAGDGTEQTLSDSSPTDPQRFYRIQCSY